MVNQLLIYAQGNYRARRNKNQNGKFRKPYYSIQSVAAEGKVLDVCQEGEHPGSLIIWEGYAGQNQMFTLKQKGGHYFFVSKKDNLYLTAESDDDGAKVLARPKDKYNPAQKWMMDKRGDTEYIIYNSNGKALDVCEGKDDNGTQIILWEENGGKNQLWTLCDPKEITSSSSEQEDD